MKRIGYSWGVKTLVAAALVCAILTTMLCAVGYSATVWFGFQSSSYARALDDVLATAVYDDITLLTSYATTDPDRALDYAQQQSMAFQTTDSQGNVVLASSDWTGADKSYSYRVGNTTVALDSALDAGGTYTWVVRLVSVGYAMRFSGMALVLGLAVLTLGLFVLHLRLAGHRPQEEGIVLGVKLPLDVVTVATFFLLALLVYFVYNSLNESYLWAIALRSCAGGVVGVLLFVWYCTYLTVCVKTGHWYRYTVIGWLCGKVVKICKELWHFGCELTLPVVAFGGTLAGVFALLCLLCTLPDDLFSRVFLWILTTLVMVAAIGYCTWMMRKLERAGAVVASGDLQATIDTRNLMWGFRTHGNHLNTISTGLHQAVEQQMKSERLKTQLITNVSHDLKTPLTSILNYADLISKEPCDNPKIGEYSAVLMRQGQRLKTLTDNLLEASKAATGNVEVNLVACNVTVMAEQIAGEYAQRLEDCNLTLVHRLPEPPLTIQADGQLLWRVFDNLMNNICKYSQPHTRVYLTAQQVGDVVEITFKNTSRYELDCNPKELLERFSRGDSARHTEGNGLGLAIAQNLIELQKGTFALAVDGDLFKATVVFPV